MTKEQEQATLAALLEEKRGYELRQNVAKEQAKADDLVEAAAGEELASEMAERLKGIDAQLKALGQGAKKPSSTSSKRPSTRRKKATSR